jgi:formylglycine-generating enzyme required for sulfatase activity
MTMLKQLLQKTHHNLQTLREREAKYGGNAPLELLNQIDDHVKAIELTEQAIAGELSEPEWREKMQPLLVAIENRSAGEASSSLTIGDITGDVVSSIIAGRDVVIIYNYPPPPAPAAPEAEAVLTAEAIPANPYRGLFAFRPEHAPFFFGRETFTQTLVQAVESRRLVALLGASGSGKSSVVFAGLVPALLKRPGEPWLFTTFRPGDDPFHNLANALLPLYETDLTSKTAQLGASRDLATSLHAGRYPLADVFKLIRQARPDHRLLLIADQFEELYTLCPEATLRQQFLEVLLAALDAPETGHLVLTLRADFLGQALLYRPLADALQNTDLKLGPMTRVELTEAIEKPAARQGVAFEEKLVKRLLDDVGEEEGSLPLLEFALTELWQHQQRRSLTHVAYDEIGEVKGALSRHADKAYRRLTPTEQAQARRVLVQLVNPGAGTEDTRRLATRAELDQNWALVAKLASERLVVTNQMAQQQDTVEVAHEALIRHWQQLRRWMDEDRTFRAWQERLRFAMAQWQLSREEAALLRGSQLAEAEGWLAERPADLSQAEKSYIEASLAQQRRQERNRRLLLARAVGAAVLMALLAVFSLFQWQDANRQRAALAQQNEKAQAELNFYQATDPTARLAELSKLFNRPDPESPAKARQLFFTLPKVDQVLLLRVADERLLPAAQAILPNLADVNRTGYTDEHLQALLETLPGLPDAGAIPDRLKAWLVVRQAARDKEYQAARTQYDDLIKAAGDNPALHYERAGVLAALGEPQAALADLEQVITLAQAPAYATTGTLPVGPEFASGEQMVEAVRRLMMVYPRLIDEFKDSTAKYASLTRAKLVFPTVMTDAHNIPMVLVPAGPFNMGSNYGYSNEQPVHRVNLDKFYIDKYEVTNTQFAAFLREQGNQEEGGTNWLRPDASRISQNGRAWQIAAGYDRHPVTGVSWYGAKAYCEWRGGRLPTEAEWEKAARGDDQRTYPWGEQVSCNLANYYPSDSDNSCVGDTTPVGAYPAGVSSYGAYDMAGNVWEWVQSEYRDYPYKADGGRENLDSTDVHRVLRGGSWDFLEIYARASNRNDDDSLIQFDSLGFRCVATGL